MSPRYSATFAVLASAAATGAALADWSPIRLILANTSLAFLALAIAYAGAGSRILGKRPDGRRAWWAYVILWPYFVLNAFAFRLARSGPGPAVAEVSPNLWFGRRLTAAEARLSPTKWVAVLDLAAEFAEVKTLRNVSAYRSLPVLDATPPTTDQLRDVAGWLREQTSNGPVFVHCALGHGRTGTVVIAYLITVGVAKDVPEGLAMLRALRPGVGLHESQKAALRFL
jgi:protein-tyrosine phosphatase